MASLALNNNTASKDIFPFFQLPQELCDQIFDASLVEVNVQLKCRLHLKAEDTVATNLLLVSKDFTTQYEARATGKAKLTISDDHKFVVHEHNTIELPAGARKTCKLHIKLQCMLQHLWWMQSVLSQMPLLADMSVVMLVRIRPRDQHPIDQVRSFGYQNLVQLKSFEYYDDNRWEVGQPFDLGCATKMGRYCPERRDFLKLVGGVERPSVEVDLGDLIGLS